jgi:hypothetical protein
LGQLDSLKFEPHLQLRHFCSPYHQHSALLGLRCEVLGIHAEVWFATDSSLEEGVSCELVSGTS